MGQQWSAALGAQLKMARLRASLSRADLAEELQVSQESVRRWEQGGSRPSEVAVSAYLRVVGAEELAIDETPSEPSGASDADIGALIRHRRAELGLSQVAAAAVIGVAQPTLAGWEIGRARPGRDLAAALAEFLAQPIAEVERLLHLPLTIDMANWPPFGRILGERRMTLQLDRPQLAARVHVSPRTIAAWELGDKVPNNSHLRLLAEVLGVELAVLVSALPERLPPTELGRLIYRRQRLLGLSREDLAIAADVAPMTVGRWIWGHHAPSGSSIAGLARALELDERIIRTAIAVD